MLPNENLVWLNLVVIVTVLLLTENLPIFLKLLALFHYCFLTFFTFKKELKFLKDTSIYDFRKDLFLVYTL